MVEESLANLGATIMGRNMFGGHPGPWNARKPWNGWWAASVEAWREQCQITATGYEEPPPA